LSICLIDNIQKNAPDDRETTLESKSNTTINDTISTITTTQSAGGDVSSAGGDVSSAGGDVTGKGLELLDKGRSGLLGRALLVVGRNAGDANDINIIMSRYVRQDVHVHCKVV
jgi:hypothetical protein